MYIGPTSVHTLSACLLPCNCHKLKCATSCDAVQQFCHHLALCRNLEYHSRPDIATIVELLVVPSNPALLDIPQESLSCVAKPQLATRSFWFTPMKL